MKNILKAATLESKFPLLKVEQGCILSKDADITVAYSVTLPELFTISAHEYEAIHMGQGSKGASEFFHRA